MTKGYLALVLHAHLPYVRHPEYDSFLEERWFFEAMTETYIPLIKYFEYSFISYCCVFGLRRDERFTFPSQASVLFLKQAKSRPGAFHLL